MKVMKKVLIVLMIFLLAITFIKAGTSQAYDWSGKIDDMAGADVDEDGVVKSTKQISGAILTVIRVICVGVAIIMLVVLAIKYMSSAPGDRATIKKHAVVYVVGAIIMFASSGILGIIQNFAGSISASK